MASAVRRATSSLGSLVPPSLLAPKSVVKSQACGMVCKELRDKDFKRPSPFPYKEKKYSFMAAVFDRTTWRFDENSKVIVVDGPFASRKAEYSKKIAEEFDLLHIPHAKLDHLYITPYGQDLRQIDDIVPPKCKSFDTHQFLANPNDERAAILQVHMFRIRLCQYIDGLAHVLNTGQGVVLDRCVYSDFVFVDTYHKFGYLSKEFRDLYYQLWNCLKPDLMRPHAVIYLDTPVDVVIENIKKRNNPVEVNSPVYRPEVLKELENNYKQKYLKEIGKHAELLVYDWTEPVDPEIMVEDLERLNLDDYGKYDPKMYDWRQVNEWFWNNLRMTFTNKRGEFEAWVDNMPAFRCPELIIDGESNQIFEEARDAIPGNKYVPGYNEEAGDANIIFKTGMKKLSYV